MRTDRLREFTFTLTYDEGEDPVADVFHSHPNLEALTIDVTTGRTSFVRLVQLRGPPDVADRLQTILEDRDYLPERSGRIGVVERVHLIASSVRRDSD